MSVYLSYFTEIGMMNFTAEDVLSTDTPYEMIRFGIWHNFMNDDSHIQPCRAWMSVGFSDHRLRLRQRQPSALFWL